MRKVFAVLTISILGLGGCRSDPTSAPTEPLFARTGSSTASASGHVEKDLWTEQWGDVHERYSFNASYAGNGSVVGRFEVSDVYADGSTPADRVEGDVICLSVETDGRTARMGGIITQSNVAVAPAGWYAVWVVQDNGEGSDAVADKSTDLVYGNPHEHWALRRCGQSLYVDGEWWPPLPPYQGFWGDNLRANVQVRP
jgi:hypothetical protein